METRERGGRTATDLHAVALVDLELAVLDGRAQPRVVRSRIFALAVALGVVEVLRERVDAETVLGDLKLA